MDNFTFVANNIGCLNQNVKGRTENPFVAGSIFLGTNMKIEINQFYRFSIWILHDLQIPLSKMDYYNQMQIN